MTSSGTSEKKGCVPSAIGYSELTLALVVLVDPRDVRRESNFLRVLS